MGISQQIGSSSLIKPGVIDSSATRPASPYEGQVIFQKDTDQLLVWNGTAWVIPNSPAMTINPTGLELVSSQTVSGSTVNVDNVFSSTYDSYKIVLENISSVAGGAIYMKLRSSGSTTAGGYYSAIAYVQWNNTILGQGRSNSTDGWYLSYSNGTAYPVGGTVDIYNPYKASTPCNFSFVGNFWDAGCSGGGYHLSTTQWDGFSVISTGTTSGRIYVYGYRR